MLLSAPSDTDVTQTVAYCAGPLLSMIALRRDRCRTLVDKSRAPSSHEARRARLTAANKERHTLIEGGGEADGTDG